MTLKGQQEAARSIAVTEVKASEATPEAKGAVR